MNYYPFHVGDYAAHTRHLALLEDLAYRRLLDAYYLAEAPLNGSATDVARMIGMREHEDAVRYVLVSFFEQSEGAWHNKRADAEIAHYKSKQQQASNAGRASAAKRANARSTPVEVFPTDVQPTRTITNNQSISSLRSDIDAPRAAKPPKKRPGKTAIPEDFSISDRVREWARERGFDRLDEHLDAFRRKAIAKGYTYASWDDAFMEAIREDWAKLRENTKAAGQVESFRERDERLARERMAEVIGRPINPPRRDVIDITPEEIDRGLQLLGGAR